MITSKELRNKWIKFYESKGHVNIGAVSLVGDGVERFLSLPSGLCLKTIKILDNLPIKILAETGLKQFYDKKLNYPKPLYLRAPDVSMPK